MYVALPNYYDPDSKVTYPLAHLEVIDVFVQLRAGIANITCWIWGSDDSRNAGGTPVREEMVHLTIPELAAANAEFAQTYLAIVLGRAQFSAGQIVP